MCGIAGIFSYTDYSPVVGQDELLRMRDAMVNRGPDGAGLWISDDKRIGLANRRLAIMDLSNAGAQPMVSADGRYRVTFNGEIYNYRELRKELESKQCVFQSQCDTEVLLHLYRVFGVEMVRRLRGMFAFAIWDDHQKTLFLARDPFGIKPLYYSDDGKTVRFASQVKALIAGGAIDTIQECAGAVGFLLWGFVPEPYTLYRQIQAVPAGSHMTIQYGKSSRTVFYFNVRDELFDAQSRAADFRPEDQDKLAGLLQDSVSHHMLADVPVGIFLSSGIDSSLITALAVDSSDRPLHTFTLGFREYEGTIFDETHLAESSAREYGTLHQTRWIQKADFESELEKILVVMDQPTTDGINMYLVCREAARAGIKVALSGLGGDELFGGYPSFRDVPRSAFWLSPMRIFPKVLGRVLRIMLNPVIKPFMSHKYAGVFEFGGSYAGAYLLRRALFMPWEINEILDPVSVYNGLERLQTVPVLAGCIQGLHQPHANVAALELTWYMRNQLLRDADWASMAHSVELRVPLVDVTLFRALAPWIVSKHYPRKLDAVAKLRKPLSHKIINRPKSGFSVPVRSWLNDMNTDKKQRFHGLHNWALRVLPRRPAKIRSLVLVTDAYGGHGGIAKFNRDFISALSIMPECEEVVAVPRLLPEPPAAIPSRVKFIEKAAGGKLHYVISVIRAALCGPYNLIVVGHINLMPFGSLLATIMGIRSALIIHGIDAWTPHHSWIVRNSLSNLERIIGVSNITLTRFGNWTGIKPEKFRLLPNCVDLDHFTPGPKPIELIRELGLNGRTVIMTLGRLASSERYKGFDEVIEALPALAEKIPDIVYLICGDGPDRGRLEEKAARLGVSGRVKFAGYIAEQHKIDYYRAADAYVMPSRGEGFGIVFLEAMACGLPVLGSSVDGSKEALLDGELGELADPSNTEQVVKGILNTLAHGKTVHGRLQEFSTQAFYKRAGEIVSELFQ